MHAFNRGVLLPAVCLFMSVVAPLHGATISLTTNQAVFSQGDTLTLSLDIIPTDDANVPSEIHLAVVLPDGAVRTLDRNRVWKTTLEPLDDALPLAYTHKPAFYSMALPADLPLGKYTFYLVAVRAGSPPLNSAAWLGSASTMITFVPPQKPTLRWRGVSLAGAEFGSEVLPGIYRTHYIYPDVTSVDYFQAKGMNLVRLPFRWERLQPTLYQAFDAAEQKRLGDFVSAANSRGVTVLLDPHNYARYQGNVVGSIALPNAAFADFWSRLAVLFKDSPKVLFGLMNEPYNMPTETWVSAANSAIQSIRAEGAANTIMVPGNAWTGAHSWSQNGYGTSNAVAMKQITDPGNNLVFEVHQYLDADSSGKSAECKSTAIGAERLQDFTAWLRANGKQGFLGEFGGGDNAVCNQAVSGLLDYIEANSDVWLGWAWWAAGPWWVKGEFFSIEPIDGADKPQMSVLTPHLR